MNSRAVIAVLKCVLLGVALIEVCSGCRRPTSPDKPVATPTARDLFREPSGELVEESWNAHYIRDAKVGNRHVRTFREETPDGPLYQIEAVDTLELRRFGDIVRQELTTVSLESSEGKVKQLAYRVVNGDSTRTVNGIVHDGTMELEDSVAGTSAKTRYAWADDQRGIFAVERTLLRQPMQVGERRSLLAFLPLLDRIVQVELAAIRLEMATIGDNDRELLRIESVDPLAEGWRIPTVYWCDVEGHILKTKEAFLDRQTVQVTEAEANRRNDLVRVDLGVDIGVKLERAINRPLDTTRAVYRISLEDLNPKAVFANCLSQRVIESENNTALVTVSKVTPDQPTELDIAVSQPKPEDLSPNAIIQSDHPRVVALANAVAETVEDPWQAAKLLENFLYRSLSKEDFSQVFSSAGEVAESRKGDCSEHAVLLAATCRARGIPARVAIGLFYAEREQSFLYHMWTEVWIKDRWVPLDATLGRGSVGGCYLKLRDSSLAHQSPYALVSPVIYLIDKLKIEPMDLSPSAG